MEWILIVLHFSGPTSADTYEIKRFATEQECKTFEQENARWGDRRKAGTTNCFPVPSRS